MPDRRIRRALISVYDKTGIVDFARALVDEFGIEIISTGGTARLLKDNDIPVTLVEEITGFPEMLDGRVKTLHPKIHAAILADRDNPEHIRQLAHQGIEPIDMVVVNLYPFKKTIAKPDCTLEEAIEMIDIGGVALLRAGAKNHKQVLALSTPSDCTHLLSVWRGQHAIDTSDDLHRDFAFGAFWETMSYDAKISEWLSDRHANDLAIFRVQRLFSWGPIRYGENPHQSAELLQVYENPDSLDLTAADTSWSDQRDLSFNNYLDASAALELCAELNRAQGVWHRRPAGEGVAPASRRCGGRWERERLAEERYTRRNLPHIQNPGRTYFVTFRIREGQLPPRARDVALAACQYWHGRRMSLHIAVVMPDHVHLLLTPYHDQSGGTVSLGELLHSVKSYSAKEINRVLPRSGSLWLDENWDRIMRNEAEFLETWEYIATNPDRAGLGGDYRWIWRSEAGFQEGGMVELNTRRHQQDAGATQGLEHRQDAGATTPGLAACVFVKHTNACGVGLADAPIESYRRAYLGDPNAAMGGVLACNFDITPEFAEAVMGTYARWGKNAGAGGFFVEVWQATSFQHEAVEVIRAQKRWGERVRLLDVGDVDKPPSPDEMDFKRIAGGLLKQNRDLVGLNEEQWKAVSKRQPTDQEMADLRLAWLICKHTKSNAITVCKDGMLIGNGAGQMSRVMSCRIATWLAKENGHTEKLVGSVAASDGFFPFRDGPDILMDAGVKALIQPGGSKRDQDTIAACDERGVAMIFTGTRHFRH